MGQNLALSNPTIPKSMYKASGEQTSVYRKLMLNFWAVAAVLIRLTTEALLFVEQSLLGFSKTEQSRAEKILEMENSW